MLHQPVLHQPVLHPINRRRQELYLLLPYQPLVVTLAMVMVTVVLVGVIGRHHFNVLRSSAPP